MDTLSRRFFQVLQAKLRDLEEANKRGGNVYMDYKRARFGFAKSLIVHEITESILLIAAAHRLGIQLAYAELDTEFNQFFYWLQSKTAAKGDNLEVSGLVSELIADFPRFRKVLESRFLEGQPEEPELSLRIPESLFGSFRLILGLHLSLLEQPTVLSYLEGVRTVPRQTWKNLISDTPTPPEVALAADSEDLTSAALFFGFLFMASTMARLNAAVGTAPTSEEAADSALLLEYVRGALDWRLDFKTPESFSRFEEIKGAIVKATSKELPYRAAKLFEDEFELILNEAFHLIPA
jgi:hypothetical protein